LLGQIDLAVSLRTAFGLVIVNLFRGIVASIAFMIVMLWPELPWLFLILLVVGLLFGGRAAADVRTGKVYAGVLVIFLILFGLGISPLPGSSQGNRISNLSEDFGEECVLPSGPLDLDAQGAL